MAYPIKALCREQRPGVKHLDDDDGRALDNLDRIYGHDYDLAITRGCWMACGLDTGRWLVASCAAELRRLIIADAAPQ